MVTDVSIKTLYLGNRVEIIAWSLESRGTEFKVAIEEADTQEEHSQKETASSKWVENISFDISWGDKVKKGLKGGISGEQSKGIETTVKWTQGSNKLGDVNIEFGQNVITNEFRLFGHTFYSFRTYPSGSFEITFRPKRIQ